MQYSENPRFNAFVKAYINAMLWSTPGDDTDHLLEFELAPETLEQAKVDCYTFYKESFVLLSRLDAEGLHSFELSGHDFWLTRAGHGVGFWDRGLGGAGDLLTKASKSFKELHPYIGDDNLIHI